MTRNFIHEHRWFFAIVSVAVMYLTTASFCLKILSVNSPTGTLQNTYPIGGGGFDSIQYPTLASNILHYGNFSMYDGPHGDAETFRTPGYPFFVAAVEWLTGTIDVIPFFQILLLAASALLFYLTALAILPRSKVFALISVAVFMFDPAVFFASEFVATEILYGFLFIACFYLLIRKPFSDGCTYALAGVALGLSALVRPAGIFLILPILIWFAIQMFSKIDRRKLVRNAVIVCAVAAVFIIPWFVRNGVRTGVYGFSSLIAYNFLNFNVPLYLNYKGGYKEPIEAIRTDLHQMIGNISDDQQLDIRNSPLMTSVIWSELRPNIFGYALFHASKTSSFLFSPGTRIAAVFFGDLSHRAAYNKPWTPELSVVNSVLDGRWQGVADWLELNWPYIPESALLIIFFFSGIYWSLASRRHEAKLIVGTIIFMALLTSPISNPRYRTPVLPFMYLSGLAGISLAWSKIRSKEDATSIGL